MNTPLEWPENWEQRGRDREKGRERREKYSKHTLVLIFFHMPKFKLLRTKTEKRLPGNE